MGKTRSRLRRWHVWLGWIVALPILLWTLSGLVMVARPIEEVRGTHLVHTAAPITLDAPPVVPRIEGLSVSHVMLEPRAAGPRWVVTLSNGKTRLADPRSGAWLPPLSAADAAAEFAALYTGNSPIKSVTRTDPDRPPLELRHDVATWKVALEDGTNFYIDANSGTLHAKRTRWWRIYDWMWGLHIMDLKTREDTHNPLVIGFGIAALVMSFLALALLPMTINRRRRGRLLATGTAPPGGQESRDRP